MTVYWLTFRISEKKTTKGSDKDRRDNLYSTIGGLSTRWWKDPTSFIIFESSRSIDKISKECKAVVSSNIDIVLIRKMENKSARLIGKTDDMDIYSLIDYLEDA